MKFYKLILIISFLSLNNCSLSNDSVTTPQVIKIYWNLVNTSGGVAGVDDDFQIGTITWSFNEATEILTVVNNNTDNTKQDFLDSGEYGFSVLTVGEDLFLVIDSVEIGRFTVTSNQLIINGNETSEGTVTDGFNYTFTKTTVTE
jgi:hypothetical protein